LPDCFFRHDAILSWRVSQHKPVITQAFVLGAGLGTRLRPLTDELPKPLVPIFQKRLITFALDHLIAAGVESFVINTHRYPELFNDLFSTNAYGGRSVRLVHESVLLETGGGIKNAEPFLGCEPFITYSGDILTDVQLQPLIDEHFRRENEVTLALRETGLSTEIAFRDGRVVDIAGKYGISGSYDFANIAIWDPKIFRRILPAQKISFIPVLIKWIGEGGKIGGVVLGDGKWFNIGSRNDYLNVHRTIVAEQWHPRHLRQADWSLRVSKQAHVDASAQIRGASVVGAGCRVGAGAILHDTILWPGAQIASRSVLENCIVRTHRTAEGTLRDAII
jgi:NDP-sugar pyrophosphorylase family protein